MTYWYQATLGKMAVGVKVTAEGGEEAGLGKIILRETAGKIISAITLSVGYIMAGFTKKKQALHDIIAQTTVVYKSPKKKVKTWVIIIVAIAFFLIMVAIIGLFSSIVLVSLESARNKANQAAIEAYNSSIIPAIIIQADELDQYKETRGTYLGFVVTNLNEISAENCNSKMRIDISPDGLKYVVSQPLCGDGSVSYCYDNNSDDVEQADTSFILSQYRCK